jgi:hypothetical protein
MREKPAAGTLIPAAREHRTGEALQGAWIASTGQTDAHAPQSMHFVASMLYLSPSLMASTGHSP